MKDRVYVCSCGKEYFSPEGLRKHLNATGHPFGKCHARIIETGEIVPIRQGRPPSPSVSCPEPQPNVHFLDGQTAQILTITLTVETRTINSELAKPNCQLRTRG